MELNVKIFLDGCDQIFENSKNPRIAGFTTNPALMRKAGITDYEAFAKKVLAEIPDKPVAFEVLSDDMEEMYRQAKKIASWGDNVNVKIPITNTAGHTTIPLIEKLIAEDVTVNVTAVTTIAQVVLMMPVFERAKKGYLSIFCGRIADCGVDPVPVMERVVHMVDQHCRNIQIIWASAREVYNVIQADKSGCDIITIGSDLLKKIPLFGKDLTEMSRETVEMFFRDGQNFKL